jgi:hypothetical protein
LLAAVLVGSAALERRSWPLAGLATVLGAVAVLLKLPAVVVVTLPVVYVLVSGRLDNRRLAQAALVTVGPLGAYLALTLGPTGPALARLMQFAAVEPFSAFWWQRTVLLETITVYLPLGLPWLALLGFILGLWRRPRFTLVCATVVGGSIAPWLIVSHFSPSRYYLPALPYVLALAALALVSLPALVLRLGRASGAVAATAAAVVLAASTLTSAELVANHRLARLTPQDRWQYQSGWPSGYGYAEAARFVASRAEPGAAVAYVIDRTHRVGVGFLRPPSLQPGVAGLGIFGPTDHFQADHPGPIYVLVDDPNGDATEPGERARQVQASEPGLRLVASFKRPGAETGVTVFRLR